jgi:Conserved hypothetical protein 2217 (DUF2460)
MTDFHEVRFPDNIAYGATGGPEFATTVVATGAGHEKRNVNWAEARGRWDVASRVMVAASVIRPRTGWGTHADWATDFHLLENASSGALLQGANCDQRTVRIRSVSSADLPLGATASCLSDPKRR